MPKKKEQPNFEQSIERLEQIVQTLEGQEVSLDESLKLFEEGVKMVRVCSKTLGEAERKVEVLLKNTSDGPEYGLFEQEELL